MKNLNYIYNNNDVKTISMLMMKIAPFNQLVQTLPSRKLLKDSIHTCLEEQVAVISGD
jgi:hypothetical protein